MLTQQKQLHKTGKNQKWNLCKHIQNMATQSECVNATFACDCFVTMLNMTSANYERLLECART